MSSVVPFPMHRAIPRGFVLSHRLDGRWEVRLRPGCPAFVRDTKAKAEAFGATLVAIDRENAAIRRRNAALNKGGAA